MTSNRARGRYRIIAHLRGGEATEVNLVTVESGPAKDRLAVLKRLKLSTDAEPQLLARFANEARLCQRLDHPNIAKLIEAGQDEDGPLLIFEYVEGPTLARLRSRAVKRGMGVPLAIALRIVKQIAMGLAHAHELADENDKPLKIVHRHVSPDNVTVTYDGDVKLCDFGMATTVASTAKSGEERVKSNVAYMAPEQARSEFGLDPRADIFALGVILWELVAGKRLWDGLSEVDVLARLADDNPLPTLASVKPDLPPAINALCTQALEKVRDERFDTANDLVVALEKTVRSGELTALRTDVAAFVTSLFEDERAKMRAVIAEARAATGSSPDLAAIGQPRPADASSLVDIESDPKLRFGPASKEETPDKRVVEVIKLDVPPPDNRFAYAMGAAVVVVLGVVAILALKSPSDTAKPEPKAYVPPTRPGSTTTAQPLSSAVTEPEDVMIDIRVTPADAGLFIDAVRRDNPYHARVVPASFQHSIRAEAEGFEPRTMTIAFDRERSIEIALVLVPPKPPVWQPPPKPKPDAEP